MPSASETTPLLVGPELAEEIQPGDVPAATSGGPAGASGPGQNGSAIGAKPNGADAGREAGGEDGGDLERQTSIDEERARQFAGNAAVQSQMKYILPAASIGVLLAAADQTIVASSYGRIGSDLKELNKSSWIFTAYLITLTSFQPLYGKLSDIFGRKSMLLLAYVLFTTGCLWCGLARSMDELIAARAWAGIGGGGMTTVVSILMSDIVPLQSRGLWQGIVNLVYATGGALGAPLGGILADTIGWRWAFIGQAPICCVAFIACYFSLQLPQTDKGSWVAKLKRVDFLGAFSLVAVVSLLLVGLDRGSNIGWSDKVAIITLSVSAPIFVFFIYVEKRLASEPFAPGRVILAPSMIGAFLCNLFSFGGWFGVLFYVPLYFQGVGGVSAATAGVRLLPAIVCSVTGSLAAGLIMRRTGRYYWLTCASYLLLTLAAIPMVACAGWLTTSVAGVMAALAVGALGNGSGVTSSLIALISNAKPADQAIATACSYLFRSLGSVLGTAAIATLLQQQLRVKLTERLSAGGSDVDDLVRRVRESLEVIDHLPPHTADIVRSTYGESLRNCFALAGAFTALAFVSSLFVHEQRLSK